MPNPIIKVYGTNWCGDCRRARRYLDQNNIQYDFINIDSNKEAEQFVLTSNRGMRSVPTIVVTDTHGHVLGHWTSLPANGEIRHAAEKARAESVPA